jgi:hypothetical protein
MKTKKTELDVDFIGGEGPLTVAEEKAISEYITKRKAIAKKSSEPKKQGIPKRTKARV